MLTIFWLLCLIVLGSSAVTGTVLCYPSLHEWVDERSTTGTVLEPTARIVLAAMIPTFFIVAIFEGFASDSNNDAWGLTQELYRSVVSGVAV